MIKFNGMYKWNGTKQKHSSHKPVSWWPGSCRLTIVDLSEENPYLYMLKPVIVFAAETKKGYSVSSRYQDFVKIICREFNLDKDKVLWIAYNMEESDKMKAATFVPESRFGNEIFYSVKWRNLMPNEIKEISRFLPLLTAESVNNLT